VPRVSVIVPARNAEDHLDEALQSVAKQTFRDWEVVVADDASSDRTAEVAMSHERVSLVRIDRAAGPSAARNAAVERSTGELLAFLDADDYWERDYLVEQVALFDRSREAGGTTGIVACNARLLGPSGFLPRTYMDHVGTPDGIDLRKLLSSNPIYTSALTPRTIFDEVGGFCSELTGSEDWDLWLRIVERGYRVVASRRLLAVYRLGPTSLSSNGERMARNERLLFERALQRGRLTPAEARIARRELRKRGALLQIAAADGLSLRTVRALPLLARVAAENPRSWRLLPRLLRRGPSALTTRFE
jgi:glycosyltransferase involved in cell wall biosynthesis